jgi:hypothetical protein
LSAGYPEEQHTLLCPYTPPGEQPLEQGYDPLMTGERELCFSFKGAAETKHREGDTFLHCLTDAVKGLLPMGKEDNVEPLLLGKQGNPNLGLCNDAQSAFRAENDLPQIRAGGRSGKRGYLQKVHGACKQTPRQRAARFGHSEVTVGRSSGLQSNLQA